MNDILTFTLVALLLVISPGPNGVLIVKTMSSSDKKCAFLNIVGICSATFFHGAFSIFGLSALLLQSAQLFLIVKLLGAAYLFYIGAKAMINAFKTKDAMHESMSNDETLFFIKKRSMMQFFSEGFLTQILNPKVSMFYLAAFPQFLSFEQPSMSSAFILVAIHATLIFCWFVSLINLFDKIKTLSSKRKAKWGKWLQGFSGSVMIYFSALIVLQK